MAVTSIWPIHGRVDKVIDYVRNPEKTTEAGLPELASLHAVEDVVEYAADEMKTERRSYVSCLNCREDTAAAQFMETKRLWGKPGGRVGDAGRLIFIGRSNTMSKTYLRGDLYYADLGHGIGSEQKGTRPVVIIQNNVGNKHSPTVIIAAVTSKANVKAKLPTHYYLDAGNGLVQPSLVLLEQIRTVDKRRLSGYIGRLDEEHIRGINHALAISIGLIEPVPPKLTLCLCDACADAFRGTGAFVLREAAQGQAEEKVCVYCGQYPGIEYVVTPKGGAGV